MAGIPHRYRSQPAIRPGDGHHRNVRVHLGGAVAAIRIRAPPVHRYAGETLPELHARRRHVVQRCTDDTDRLLDQERRVPVNRLPLLLVQFPR